MIQNVLASCTCMLMYQRHSVLEDMKACLLETFIPSASQTPGTFKLVRSLTISTILSRLCAQSCRNACFAKQFTDES